MLSLDDSLCPMSRRQCLSMIGLPAQSLGLIDRLSEIVVCQEPSKPPAGVGALAPLNRYRRMVHEFFVERVRGAEEAGFMARSALRTKADAEAYVAGVQRKIRSCFQPFPE